MTWSEDVIWWQVYPLGFVGAPIREADAAGPHHRLQHLIPWLDHVQALGANGLLLGPVFASSTHGYDTLDFFRIDPRLGDDADIDTLIDAAKARGIRVCFDGVFNHVSAEHPWVKQALMDGPESEFAPWFRIDWNAAGGPQPEVFEGHGSLVALNHDHPPVREFVVEIIQHWSARGVDAWRLDAAYSVTPEFWAEVLPSVRKRHPQLWFFGEVIHGDYGSIVTASTFDSVTQYELWKAIWSSLKEENFYELEHALGRQNDFLETFVPQTFVGNHDVTRITTTVGDQKAVLAAVLLMTLAGVPSIYAGDELGYQGAKAEGWRADDAIRPQFPPEPPEGIAMSDHYRSLISIRRRHRWLHAARSETLELSNTRYVYRMFAGEASLVVELDLAGETSAEVRAGDEVLFRC